MGRSAPRLGHGGEHRVPVAWRGAGHGHAPALVRRLRSYDAAGPRVLPSHPEIVRPVDHGAAERSPQQRAGRTWLRLEVQALAYALTTRGEAQRAHAHAALAFRAHRQRLFPDARAREDSLELQEGLAEHAGQVVASARSTLGPLRTVRTMDGVMRRPSYVRSFAYATGPGSACCSINSLRGGAPGSPACARSQGC